MRGILKYKQLFDAYSEAGLYDHSEIRYDATFATSRPIWPRHKP